MRDFITIIERFMLNEVIQLPAKVEKLLLKPVKIALKDGRTGLLSVSLRDKNNQDAALERASSLLISVEVDGIHAGSMWLHPNQYPEPDEDEDYDMDAAVRGSWSVASVDVVDTFRRQGIASAMYDTMTRAGMKILASGGGRGGKLLPNGSSLWDTRRVWKQGRMVYPYPMIWKPKTKVR